jgi:two-component system, sensor histidine kinase
MNAPSSRRVLVIDDNPLCRELLEVLLGQWGHQVAIADNGLRGVQLATTWHPEVALVDIELPLLDGYTVARQVRAALGDQVFLVALTACCLPRDRQRALEAGFDVHLSKPANVQHLFRLLSQKAA